MKRNQGFTLIELVVVIVVLGLLAVAALPRFVDVTDQAKEASIEGVAGGFATAVLSARAQWEGEGRPIDQDVPANNNYSVNYDGQVFWLTKADNTYRDGYPTAPKGDGSNGYPSAYQNTVTDLRCSALMRELLQNPPSVTPDNDETITNPKYIATAQDTTTCRYTQQQGKAHYFEYDLTQGSVSVTLDN